MSKIIHIYIIHDTYYMPYLCLFLAQILSHTQEIKDLCSQTKIVAAALKKGIKDLESLEKVLTQPR